MLEVGTICEMGIILNLNVCKETGICVLDITYIIATYEITQVFILEIHGGRLNKRLFWFGTYRRTHRVCLLSYEYFNIVYLLTFYDKYEYECIKIVCKKKKIKIYKLGNRYCICW